MLDFMFLDCMASWHFSQALMNFLIASILSCQKILFFTLASVHIASKCPISSFIFLINILGSAGIGTTKF